MGWWRRKADDEHSKDNILELDTIVWRGINQFDRMHRLAENAENKQAAEAKTDSLPMQKAPLVSVPLPVESQNDEDAITEALERDAEIHGDHDDFIEEEIRQQILSDAMTAVLAFQDGQTKADENHPLDEEIQDEAQPEASVEQHIAQELNDKYQSEMPSDMSGAIRSVVANEIGGWLQQNMARIVAETMSQIPIEDNKAGAKPAPKTVKKSVQKSAKKSATKTSKTAPQKLKAKAKTASKTVVKSAPKSKSKKAPKTAQKTRAKK